MHDPSSAELDRTLPNGFGAAAILAAGIGCFAVGALTVVAFESKAFARHMILYGRTGPLSGVTTGAIVVWLATWIVLSLRWRGRDVALRPILTLAFIFLGASLLLTFPPIVDLF